MPRYVVETNMGFCGTDETFIVEADNEDQAEHFAWEALSQNITVGQAKEAEEEDEEQGYAEL